MSSEKQNVSDDDARLRLLKSDVGDGATVSMEQLRREHVIHVCANDPDELSASVPAWDAELTQLRTGAFSAQMTFIQLESVFVTSGKWDQPLLMKAASPRGCVTVNRPGRGSAPVKYRGHVIEDDECYVSGSAAEGECMNMGIQCPTGLSVHLDALHESWLDRPELLATRGMNVCKAGLTSVTSLFNGIAWIVAAVAEYPDTIARAEVRLSLADQLLARVDAFGAREFPVSQDRETRIRRRLGVERAREYINRNLTEPIRLSHLCRYARTGSRSLEYGFMEAVGLSPMVYVRVTRLHRVRRMLRSRTTGQRSISEIAMDCGFWHLSQFAMDYKALFGESPSITVRRTKMEYSASERRLEAMTG
jgi:AraC family transcriptional regulator, ethanolamine operon transcriptional activator